MRLFLLSPILLISAGAFAQPTPTAVTDAASFTNRVAPGSLATIFGSKIAVMNANASTIPLPFSLGNVQVTVDGFDAPIIFTGITPYTQVNFQMPVEVQPGTANLVITVNGVSSDPFPVTIAATAPGIFTYDPTGGTLDPSLLQGVIQNPPDYNNSNINSPSNPAPAGSVVVVYIDGTGAVRTPLADGEAATGSNPAKAVSTATIGGFDAPVQYLGLTPGDVGLAQANIEIPAGLPSGDYPLVITVGGLQSISAVISVSGDGTLPTFLNEVSLFNDFAVSERTTLQVLDSTLYLCGSERIRVFDLTDPSLPSFIGEYGDANLNSREISCTVNGTAKNPYLVSVVGPENNPTLTVFDVSGDNLQSPTPLAEGVAVGGFTGLQKFVFDGNIGLVNTSYIDSTGSHGDILAFDFSDPSQPTLISATSTTQLLPFIRGAGTVPHTLFAVTGTAKGEATGGTGALAVIDTTDPTNVAFINQVKAPGTAILESFAATADTLVAAGNTSDDGEYISPNVLFPGNLTISTYDVSDPANPVFLTTVDTGIQATGSLRTITFDPSGVFLVQYQYPLSDINGPTSLAVVDARDPKNPQFYPQFTYYYFDGLASAKGYVYAASGNGLNIYQSVVQ
ncbi:MAG TPA: hypothetical protein VKT81_09895 [Bryobacteraceae bacterium]|nr:hypothetical protein [Bryobacteraceae bacterium]